MSGRSTSEPSPVMFRLLPLSEPSAYFPTPARCRFYVQVHKRMTRRQFQMAVVYTLSTTPGLREWFLNNRSAWEQRVDELFKATEGGQVEASCSICLGEGADSEEGAVKMLHECGHAFHSKCLHQWFRHGNTSCPCCRRVINITL